MSMDDHCIFCRICLHTADATILYEDEDYVVFKDIKPAAKYHYLVIPKAHIENAKCLTKEHIPMLERMEYLAKETLETQGASVKDLRLGFHWPPFNSVHHLHLHAISPASEMGFLQRQIFKPNPFWFVSLDYVYDKLRKQ